jgi:hypothetical protein
MTLARDVVPALAEKNLKLIAIGIGTAERAQEFSDHVKFPADLLFADPENIVYERLELVKGLQDTFFNPSTPLAIAKRLQENRVGDLAAALGQWKPWIPPKLDQGLQQGGAFVFQGNEVLYARKDTSTGDHADVNMLLNLMLE